jgi:ABC-type antimicrobial peptide transport system permease subunit
LGSYHAAQLSLEERSREIGILRMIGFSKEQLFALLNLRAAWILTIAYVLGAVLAAGLLAWANRTTPLQVQSVQVEVSLTVPALLAGYPLSVACAFIGTWFSARGRLRLSVVDLVRA